MRSEFLLAALPTWAPQHWTSWVALVWAVMALLCMRRLKPNAGGKLTYDESTPAGCSGILLAFIASPVLLFAIASYFYDWWLWPTLAMLLLQPVLVALPGNAR